MPLAGDEPDTLEYSANQASPANSRHLTPATAHPAASSFLVHSAPLQSRGATPPPALGSPPPTPAKRNSSPGSCTPTMAGALDPTIAAAPRISSGFGKFRLRIELAGRSPSTAPVICNWQAIFSPAPAARIVPDTARSHTAIAASMLATMSESVLRVRFKASSRPGLTSHVAVATACLMLMSIFSFACNTRFCLRLKCTSDLLNGASHCAFIASTSITVGSISLLHAILRQAMSE